MKKETLILVGIGIASLVILIAAATMLGGKSAQKPEETAVTDTTLLYGGKENSVGSESAKITVVEFADFQCPACGSAHPIVKQILEEYKDNIHYIYRHFPLPMHKNARAAAIVAQAAGKQDKFMQMHDMLFDNQEEWGESNNPKEFFDQYATSLELDMAQFEKDQKDSAVIAIVQKDQNDGIQLGVNSTPTFFINSKMYPGVLTYDNFKKVIEENLK